MRHELVFSEASSNGGIHYISQATGKNDSTKKEKGERLSISLGARKTIFRLSLPYNTAFPMSTEDPTRYPSTVRSFNTSEPPGNFTLSLLLLQIANELPVIAQLTQSALEHHQKLQQPLPNAHEMMNRYLNQSKEEEPSPRFPN